MRYIIIAAAGSALAAPVHAQSNLERGFAGALRGCEEWVLNPASWADGDRDITCVATFKKPRDEKLAQRS